MFLLWDIKGIELNRTCDVVKICIEWWRKCPKLPATWWQRERSLFVLTFVLCIWPILWFLKGHPWGAVGAASGPISRWGAMLIVRNTCWRIHPFCMFMVNAETRAPEGTPSRHIKRPQGLGIRPRLFCCEARALGPIPLQKTPLRPPPDHQLWRPVFINLYKVEDDTMSPQLLETTQRLTGDWLTNVKTNKDLSNIIISKLMVRRTYVEDLACPTCFALMHSVQTLGEHESSTYHVPQASGIESGTFIPNH